MNSPPGCPVAPNHRAIKKQAFKVGLGVFVAFLGLVVSTPAIGSDHRIVKRLTARKEAVRLQALAEIQESTQTRYQSLAVMIRAAKELNARADTEKPLPPSQITLISLIGSVDRQESADALIEMLQCEHPEVVYLASDVLGKYRFFEAIDALAQLKETDLFDDHYGFRFNLVRSLFQMDHPDAVKLITTWLPLLDGQLKREIEKQFDDVDLETFDGDQERFTNWQDERDDAYDQANANVDHPPTLDQDDLDHGQPHEQSSGGPLKLQPASFRSSSTQGLKLVNKSPFYGMDIYARRMMFIIDHSGSMREYDQGMTRLGRAKGELIRAIEGLDPDAEFAIMVYASNVKMWRDELTRATDEAKRYAIRYVERLGYGDRTNTHSALTRSLSFDSQLEAVYLLTDGRPTEGRLTQPDAIIGDITTKNRFRHLHFNTIGISVMGGTERFLKILAKESGGQFRIAK